MTTKQFSYLGLNYTCFSTESIPVCVWTTDANQCGGISGQNFSLNETEQTKTASPFKCEMLLLIIYWLVSLVILS